MGPDNDLIHLLELRLNSFEALISAGPRSAQISQAEVLAYWLAERLAMRGVITSYPEYGVRGWFLKYTSWAGDEFFIHCRKVGGQSGRCKVSLQCASELTSRADEPWFESAAILVGAIHDAFLEAPFEVYHLLKGCSRRA